MDNVFHPSNYDPAPTPAEKALYDQFITEYVKDYNAYESLIRCGFGATFAFNLAQVFPLKPYINQRITEHKATIPVEDKSIEAQDKALVLSVAREIAQNGKRSERIAAAALMAKIRGMDVQPDKSGEALKQLADDFRELSKTLPD